MELRRHQLTVCREIGWDAEDVAEYNGVKQVGMLMSISPIIAVLCLILSLILPASYRVAAFVVGFAPLMGIGAWAAGYLSRLWHVAVTPPQCASLVAARRSPREPWTNHERRRVAVAVSRRSSVRAFGSARSVPALPVRVRFRTHPSRPAPRPIA